LPHHRRGLRRWVGPLGLSVNWKHQMLMQNAFRRHKRIALLCAALTAIVPVAALAQSGSAGGSIGNDEKSLSGSRDTPRSVEPDRSARRNKPDAEEPRRSARRSGGGAGGGSFDGAWGVVSVGCGGTTNGAIVITSGRILGEGLSGQVSPNGSATAAGAAGGVTWNSSGRFSSRSGSGSYRRSDGCVGSWTASKH
jgi:hypothetical protein